MTATALTPETGDPHIRSADFGDIPKLSELMMELYERSIYVGRATLDVRRTRGMFMNAIQRHGHIHDGGFYVLVATVEGRIEGFLVGMLDRVYPVLDKLRATDLFFFCRDGAHPRSAVRLLRAFLVWARTVPDVIEIQMAATDAAGDFNRTRALYERFGLETCGIVAKMVLDGPQKMKLEESG